MTNLVTELIVTVNLENFGSKQKKNEEENLGI